MSLAENFKQSTYLGYLAALRILLGFHFLGTGFEKLWGRFLTGRPLATDLLRDAPKDPFALHRSFILGFVIPHVHFFSYLVTFGGIAIGASLLIGCLVRISSSLGGFHNLNISSGDRLGWAELGNGT